jgi:hypothetical protein
MKKLAVLSMTLLFSLSLINGQTQKTERKALRKLEGTTVSEQAKVAFNSDFKGATNVQSKRVGTYDEFSFTNKSGGKMEAFYDYNGKLVGTTQVKTFADLPADAQKEIKAKYKDYTIGQVIFFDDNEANDTDMILYGNQFDDADNYFVEVTKGTIKIILQVNTAGSVFFFKEFK